MSESLFSRRSAFAVALVLPLSALAGCGQKGPVLYPVTGKVTASDGKSLERATVVLHPIGSSDPNTVKPRGTVGPDGAFTLTSYTAGDGAPPGEYQVTVELWAGKNDEPPTNRLPAKYARPDKSGFTATVAEGQTELKPFVVHR